MAKKPKMTLTMAADIIVSNKIEMLAIIGKIKSEFGTLSLQQIHILRDNHAKCHKENEKLYKLIQKEKDEQDLK